MKAVEFNFNSECIESLRTFKKTLVFTPLIQPPDWSAPFEIICNAYDYVVGTMLGKKKD